MQNVQKRKKNRIRPDGPLDHFLKFWAGGTLGLAIGALIAYGMNLIHPLF